MKNNLSKLQKLMMHFLSFYCDCVFPYYYIILLLHSIDYFLSAFVLFCFKELFLNTFVTKLLMIEFSVIGTTPPITSALFWPLMCLFSHPPTPNPLSLGQLSDILHLFIVLFLSPIMQFPYNI